MDIKDVAFILLIGRVISVVFISLVIKRQLGLFKKPIDPGLVGFRRILFFLSLAVLTGNLVSIVIDFLTICADDSLQRNNDPSVIAIAYALVSCVTSAVSAFLIWTMYQQAAKTVILTDHDLRVALKNTK